MQAASMFPLDAVTYNRKSAFHPIYIAQYLHILPNTCPNTYIYGDMHITIYVYTRNSLPRLAVLEHTRSNRKQCIKRGGKMGTNAKKAGWREGLEMRVSEPEIGLRSSGGIF